MYIYIYIYICVCIFIYVHMYIYIYTYIRCSPMSNMTVNNPKKNLSFSRARISTRGATSCRSSTRTCPTWLWITIMTARLTSRTCPFRLESYRWYVCFVYGNEFVWEWLWITNTTVFLTSRTRPFRLENYCRYVCFAYGKEFAGELQLHRIGWSTSSDMLHPSMVTTKKCTR